MTCGSDFRLKKLYLIFLHIFLTFSRENSRLGTIAPMMKSVWSHLKGLQEKRVLYTLPYRKYLMACVLTVFPFFYWRVLMAYVFSDFSGMGKCKISGKTNIDTWYRSFAELLEHSIIHT
jgi:hypothetical protein